MVQLCTTFNIVISLINLNRNSLITGFYARPNTAATSDKIEPKNKMITRECQNYCIVILLKYVHVRNTYTSMVVFFATSNFMEGPKPNQTRLYF